MTSVLNKEWEKAYLEQARSDWRIFDILLNYTSPDESSLPECHPLHYLQMATEKLAKALLLKGGKDIDDVRFKHRGFVIFLRTAKLDIPALAKNFRVKPNQIKHIIRKLIPLAKEIEELAPSIAKSGTGTNPEYPWQDPRGTINIPASFHFSIYKELMKPDLAGARMRKFILLMIKDPDRYLK